jgi:hypothetical protein
MSNSNIAYKLLIPTAIAVGSIVIYQVFFNRKKDTQKESENSAPVQKLKLPVIDISLFLNKNDDIQIYESECKKVAYALHHYGIAVLRDPRVSELDNNKFLELMEKYFEGSDGIRDARPEYQYQVGVTPEGTERPRNHCKRMGAIGPNNKPLSLCPPGL